MPRTAAAPQTLAEVAALLDRIADSQQVTAPALHTIRKARRI